MRFLIALPPAIVILSGCRQDPRPSLILITVDTLRADHLPVYGYSRPTAPRMELLAARGAVFEDVLAPAPETGPSCASLLTGRWPAELGVRGNGRPLGAGPPTLAEILYAAGYETAAFVSGYPLVRRLSGLDRGFSHFDDDLPDPRGRTPRVQRGAARTTEAVLAWLARRETSRPFFLWVHYYDVHGDYAPGPPYDSLFGAGGTGPFLPPEMIPAYQRRGSDGDASAYVARYDGEIRRVDDQLGRLFDTLDAAVLLPRVLVVLTADHGESLTENGYYFDHGNELYLPSLRIPLILAGPGVPPDGRRIAGPAQTPDILPTILDLLGQPAVPAVSGRSLAGAFRGEALQARETFAEARFAPYRPLTPTADVGPKLVARDDRFTAMLRLTAPRLEIYDRMADPGESRDLASGAPTGREESELRSGIERSLRDRLDATVHGRSAPMVLSPEVRSALEALARAKSGSARSIDR